MSQEKIGKFIRTLRVEKKMTQQELAEKLGVTDRAISKWENGRGMPDIVLLIPLSMELGVTLLELLSGEKLENENKAIIDLIRHKDQKTKIWKYLFIGFSNIVLSVILIILIFGFFVPMAYEASDTQGMTRILSASMEPTLKVGTGIIYDEVDIDTVKKDDIVVFYFVNEEGQFLVSENGKYTVTHRVIEVFKEGNGNVNLITKGDNNTENDKIYVTQNNFVGIYNRNTSGLTTFFLKEEIRNYPIILVFLIISIISILIFDLIQIKKYLWNK